MSRLDTVQEVPYQGADLDIRRERDDQMYMVSFAVELSKAASLLGASSLKNFV